MSKMLAPTWLAQRLRQLGDIRRDPLSLLRVDRVNKAVRLHDAFLARIKLLA